jgi:leukotriene-A4 hydrolase
LEQVYGKNRADMEAVLGRRDLQREMADLKLSDQVLHIDLKGRDPDDGLTDVPYEKGALFLKHLELTFGRREFDDFLKSYFNHFAFQSITTADFAAYLKENLLKRYPDKAAKVPVDEWLYQPGLPGTAPDFRARAFEKVGDEARAWAIGKTPAKELPAKDWSTQEWLHFLNELPPGLSIQQMGELDDALRLTRQTNSEVIFQWLLLSVRHGYEPAYPRLAEFLTSQGRRKFLTPLYQELLKTADGKKRALEIYGKARPAYHPIAVATIDALLKGK